MPKPKEVYVKCDELDNIPKPNKDNWLYEVKLLSEILPKNAKVLQVGCMDGTKAIAILKERPDLIFTGIDIEQDMVNLYKKNLSKEGFNVDVILGDIVDDLSISGFDYVICLNNTLGYISEEKKAIENMKKIGKHVIISVYGEKFDDKLGGEYFKSINLEIESVKDNFFHSKEFVNIKRYTLDEVKKWNGKIIDTVIGYFCVIEG